MDDITKYKKEIQEHEDRIDRLKQDREEFEIEFISYYKNEVLNNRTPNEFSDDLELLEDKIIKQITEFFDEEINKEQRIIVSLENKISSGGNDE